MIKNYDDQRHKPLTWKQHLENEQEQERLRKEAEERPIREAESTLNQTHQKLFQLEKTEVLAGRRDPAWTMPPSAVGLKMSKDAAKAFVANEANAYRDEHPDYYACPKNFETVVNYLLAQGVVIADRHCLAQAVERLGHFGLLEGRPAPAPEPTPVEQPVEVEEPTEAPREDLIGWDPSTGEQRSFTQREVDLMSSEEYRRVFRLCVTRDGADRRPRFTRGFIQ